MAQNHVLNSLSEFVSYVVAMDRRKGQLWFRGQPDAGFGLLPGVYRDNWLGGEYDIAEGFRKGAAALHSKVPDWENRTAWLSLMQHYRLKTRLLDWTTSPLIAALFAAEESNGRKPTDGKVWVLDPFMLNKLSTKELYIFVFSDLTKKVVEAVGNVLAISRDINEPIEDRFDNLVCAASPPHSDLRMMLQHAQFTVHSDTRPLELIPQLADSILETVTIPADKKAEFLNDLAFLGMSRLELFPDLESLASGIPERVRQIYLAQMPGYDLAAKKGPGAPGA